MAQRDIVLRWIEELGRLIARLLRRGAAGDLDLAREEIERATGDLLGSLAPLGRQPFIVVKIPQFELIAFDSTSETAPPAVNMRAIVGKALRTRTPVMLERMRYLEFRPCWNVPRSILVNEIVPILRRNHNYLQSNDMKMVWPGDRPAATGPAVARPEALAVWLLRDQPGWNLDRVRSAMNADTSSRSMLSHPVPVVIFYTTAVVRSDGSAWFYADIYGHDRELDEALRAGPTFP